MTKIRDNIRMHNYNIAYKAVFNEPALREHVQIVYNTEQIAPMWNIMESIMNSVQQSVFNIQI